MKPPRLGFVVLLATLACAAESGPPYLITRPGALAAAKARLAAGDAALQPALRALAQNAAHRRRTFATC